MVDDIWGKEEKTPDDLRIEAINARHAVNMAEAGAKDIHWARDLYGVLEERGQSPVVRPFAALNTAYATDGVVIRATGKAKRPVSLVYLHEKMTSDVAMHFLGKVEAGAEGAPGAGEDRHANRIIGLNIAKGFRDRIPQPGG